MKNVLLSDLMFVSISPSFLCRSFVDSVHPIDSLPLPSESLPDESLKHFQCSKTEPLFPPIPLRDEKVKVLKAVPELSLSDVVLGQVRFKLYFFLSFACLLLSFLFVLLFLFVCLLALIAVP